MQTPGTETRGYGTTIGLLMGAAIGAGLALWFAPRLRAELGERMADSAKRLGDRASRQYGDASARAGQVVATLSRKGRDVSDGAADAVAHGAHEVERIAMAARSDRAAGKSSPNA